MYYLLGIWELYLKGNCSVYCNNGICVYCIFCIELEMFIMIYLLVIL